MPRGNTEKNAYNRLAFAFVTISVKRKYYRTKSVAVRA